MFQKKMFTSQRQRSGLQLQASSSTVGKRGWSQKPLNSLTKGKGRASSILVNIMSRTSRREGKIGERDMIKGMLVISIEAKKVLPRDLECLPSEHLRSRVYRRELC